MADISPIQTSFNAGELTPRLWGRTDQNVRSIGLKAMTGFLPLLQGPAEAAPGSIYVAPCKGPSRAIPFQFNVTQTYVIEAGAAYFRFYTNDAQIVDDNGNPYEVATAYSWAQVQALYYVQDADALYLFHPVVPIQRMVRTGADSFTIDDFELLNGPLEARNSDKAVTVTVSETSGDDIVVTSSEALFEAGDVGGIMEVECTDFGDIAAWEAGMKVDPNPGYLIQWNGNVYVAAGGNDRTGQVAPIHTEGTEWDGLSGKDINDKGPYGVKWTYRNDRFGVLKFTAYVSETQMRAQVLRTMPDTNANYRWRFGSFSPRRGYPRAGTMWQDRLVVGYDAKFAYSVSESYQDFSIRNEFGDISEDESYVRSLPNPNFVTWMESDDVLLVGTARAEHAVSVSPATQANSAGTVNVSTPSEDGGMAIKPVKVNGRLVFVQQSGRKLVQLDYDPDRTLRQESPDLTRYADHIGSIGFVDLAWTKEPERLLWAVMGDGTLAVAAYMPDEQLLGWARRPLADGILAKSVCSIPSPDASYDQLWFTATLNGQWVMMRMAPIRQTGDASQDQIMSDAAIIYQGPETDTFRAPHLAGQTVEVVGDGIPYMGVTLDAAGNGTIDRQASTIIAGLPYPAFMTNLPLDGGAAGGTAQNKIKRVSRVDVRVLNADGIQVEYQGTINTIELLRSDSPTDTAFPLLTGDIISEGIGSYERQGEITIRRYLPKPATVLAIIPYFGVGER